MSKDGKSRCIRPNGEMLMPSIWPLTAQISSQQAERQRLHCAVCAGVVWCGVVVWGVLCVRWVCVVRCVVVCVVCVGCPKGAGG